MIKVVVRINFFSKFDLFSILGSPFVGGHWLLLVAFADVWRHQFCCFDIGVLYYEVIFYL